MNVDTTMTRKDVKQRLNILIRPLSDLLEIISLQ